MRQWRELKFTAIPKVHPRIYERCVHAWISIYGSHILDFLQQNALEYLQTGDSKIHGQNPYVSPLEYQ